jgi:CRISPR/Cas system CMR subunit Cmr6 (Cas7 group RAMP superfamily)
MASAILAVCYPDDFALYDYRVRDQIANFQKLNTSNFEKLWDGYQQYIRKVADLAPSDLSLRDKDRFLYGKSNTVQLRKDIQRSFKKSVSNK